jgi:hypothetical protein
VCTPVIPALGRLRQEDPKLEARLSYTVKLCQREREREKRERERDKERQRDRETEK